MRRLLAGLPVVLVCVLTAAILAPPALADRPATLVIKTKGLPPGQRASIRLVGPGLVQSLHTRRLTLGGIAPGRYTLITKAVRVGRSWRSARRGARAFPLRKRRTITLRAGRTRTVGARYGAIVNPGVRRLPSGVDGVVGDPANPRLLIYKGSDRLPRAGTILTAAPSRRLPAGLVARIKRKTRANGFQRLFLKPVAISRAVPAFDFPGRVRLRAPAGARASVRARASGCNGPKTLDVGVKLDEFQLRNPSFTGGWRPQLSMALAIRTTERLGAKLAVAGLSCSWSAPALGPWYGAVPTPIGVPIPVYASLPVSLNANVQGSLSAFRLNLASTTVVQVDLGSRNGINVHQEGTNVWTDGVLQFSGSARLAAKLSLVLGVGNPNVGDLHVEAGFGPTATWQSGAGCSIDLEIGPLKAGIKVRWFSKDVPVIAPYRFNIWRGCQQAAPPGGGGGGGGGGTPPSAPGPAPAPAPAPGPAPAPAPSPTWSEQQGSLGANTFTNPYNASGIGVKIQPYQWVAVSCKVYAPQIASANPDGYWYRIASAPWSNNYYAVANTFWNGDIPGQKPYTHMTDWAVPNC